jgi:hypothetical protein
MNFVAIFVLVYFFYNGFGMFIDPAQRWRKLGVKSEMYYRPISLAVCRILGLFAMGIALLIFAHLTHLI